MVASAIPPAIIATPVTAPTSPARLETRTYRRLATIAEAATIASVTASAVTVAALCETASRIREKP
jgi:hypothetical protein